MEAVGVEPTTSTKCCLICTVPIRFTRLGVPACRACAAFYKRSKINGKRLKCRQGDNRCIFRKHEKFMCRSCRYDKCVELGMEYNPVEKDTVEGELNDFDDSHKPSLSTNQEPSVLDAIKKASEKFVEKRIVHELEIVKKHKLKRLEHPTEDTVEVESNDLDDSHNPSLSTNQEPSLLDAMKIAYEKSFGKRIVHELEIVKKHKLKRLEHPTEEFYISSLHSFMEMFPTIIREIIEVFEQVFPFLQELIIEDKAAIFQDFIGKFLIIEGFYRSYTHLKSLHFFESLITCIDCENIDQWIRDEDYVEHKADFRKFVNNYADGYTQLILPLFTIEQFTEREFFALLILGFCDIDLSLDLPEVIFEKMESIRKSVFSELRDYYKNEEMISDISSRMGKLLSVSHTTSEAGLLGNEEYRTYAALFDVGSRDSLLREILYQ